MDQRRGSSGRTLCKCEALSSNPSPTKTKTNKQKSTGLGGSYKYSSVVEEGPQRALQHTHTQSGTHNHSVTTVTYIPTSTQILYTDVHCSLGHPNVHRYANEQTKYGNVHICIMDVIQP
jgi:hypothetical protein